MHISVFNSLTNKLGSLKILSLVSKILPFISIDKNYVKSGLSCSISCATCSIVYIKILLVYCNKFNKVLLRGLS